MMLAGGVVRGRKGREGVKVGRRRRRSVSSWPQRAGRVPCVIRIMMLTKQSAYFLMTAHHSPPKLRPRLGDVTDLNSLQI